MYTALTLTLVKMRDSPFRCHSPNTLSIVNEKEYPEVDEKHSRCEYPRNDRNTVCFNPCENCKSESKGQSPLACNKDTKQLCRITIITVNLFISDIPEKSYHICNKDRKSMEIGRLIKSNSNEHTNPM
jgi:hypothetical protein